MHSSTFRDLAHASIPVPRGMAHLGVARVDVFLRATHDGRYRWFHTNGSPTVVEGTTVEQAVQVARLVWTDVQLVTRDEPPA